MSEQEQPRGRGRPPKKPLEQDHHFQPISEISVVNEGDGYTSEPPIQPLGNLVPEESEDAVGNFIVENADNHIAHESESISITENTSASPVISSPHEESPIEEKIHQLVDSAYSIPLAVELNGWHILNTDIVIMTPPRNGMPVCLSETTDGQGIEAFWKRTRAFANGTKRWQEHGAWYDFITGTPIRITPKYWKERF